MEFDDCIAGIRYSPFVSPACNFRIWNHGSAHSDWHDIPTTLSKSQLADLLLHCLTTPSSPLFQCVVYFSNLANVNTQHFSNAFPIPLLLTVCIPSHSLSSYRSRSVYSSKPNFPRHLQKQNRAGRSNSTTTRSKIASFPVFPCRMGYVVTQSVRPIGVPIPLIPHQLALCIF